MTTPDEGFPAIWERALEALDDAVPPPQRAFVRLARPVGAVWRARRYGVVLGPDDGARIVVQGTIPVGSP